MADNQKVFSGVTKGMIQQFQGELGANCTLGQDGVTYTIKDIHILAQAVFNKTKNELTVTIVHKPWIIPMDMVWGKIQSAIVDTTKKAEKEPAQQVIDLS